MRASLIAASLLAISLAAPASSKSTPAAVDKVIELTKQSITLRSVRGEGNETDKVAELFRDALLADGWSAD